MKNIKYLNEDFYDTEEDSEVINEAVDNPKDLKKYAQQIEKKYKLDYDDDDSIVASPSQIKQLEIAHKILSHKMICGIIRYCGADKYYFFTVDFD